MGICIFMPAPIGGYLAAADGSQATQSGSAHVRMAVPRCLVLGGRWCRGERSGNWSANRRAGAPQRKKRLLLSVVSFVEGTRYFPFPSGARNRELTNRRGVQVYRVLQLQSGAVVIYGIVLAITDTVYILG